MRIQRFISSMCLLVAASSLAFGVTVKEEFPHQVRMLTLPEYLADGRLFLDPELASGNWFGGGLAVGDWNRDGHHDIFISSFLSDPDGVANAGYIYVFLGPDYEKSERITALPELISGDNFGMQISFEDMNGDRVSDLIVTGLRTPYFPVDGSAVLDKAGSFRVIYGPDYQNGIQMFEETPEANATLGRGLAVADFNEDGSNDIAVGVIGAYNGVGKVLFRFGPDYKTQQELFSPIVDDGMRFGVNLAAGDWNRDGHVDLIIGADKAYSQSSFTGAGLVEIWYGPEYKSDNVAILEEPIPTADNNFGAAVDFGDLNGDGYNDLAVGVSNSKKNGKSWVGKVVAFFGPEYDKTVELESPTPEENAIFGSEVEIADVNDDGINDLVVGEYYATVDGKAMAGRAWLFLGLKTDVRDWTLFE